jgi:hypothetical protein
MLKCARSLLYENVEGEGKGGGDNALEKRIFFLFIQYIKTVRRVM